MYSVCENQIVKVCVGAWANFPNTTRTANMRNIGSASAVNKMKDGGATANMRDTGGPSANRRRDGGAV